MAGTGRSAGTLTGGLCGILYPVGTREDKNDNNGILSQFLKTYRAEVLGMILTDFDAEKYERTIREEGREAGRKEGIAQNIVSSVESIMNNLNVPLYEACRLIGVTINQYEASAERINL